MRISHFIYFLWPPGNLRRGKLWYGVALLWPFLHLCASAQEGPVVLTPALINELAEEARTNNAALWANCARVRAAEENAKSIPLWRDPQLIAGGMTANRAMRSDWGDIIYGVEQSLPVFGKEKAAKAAAQTDIAIEQADLETQFQTVRKLLAQALFQAAMADELLALSRRDLAWLETRAGTVEQRYEAGSASQVDVLRVQNERSKQAEEVRSNENMRHSAYVSVNRLLNRNLMAGWAEMKLPPIPGPVPFTDRLLGLAAKFDPKVRTLRKQLEKAKAMVDASRSERRPDLSAAVEGRSYSGTGGERSAEIVLKMKVPWFNDHKYQAAIRRDQARVTELENQIEDYTQGLRAEVHHLTARIDSARREALLYRDQIIPRTEQAVRSVEAEWRASRDAFREVLEAQRMLIEARTGYVRAVADEYSGMSELILCCGIGNLEALEMLGKEDHREPSSVSEP